MYHEAAIINAFQDYGYFAVFPLLAFGGPLAALAAGFLASQGYFSPWIIWPIAVLADLTADVAWYVLGRFGRERIYRFFQKFFSVADAAVRAAEGLFERHGRGKIIFFSKATMGLGFLGQFMLMFQGFFKIPFGVFIFYNFLAGVVLSGAATLGGYYFGIAFAALPKKERIILLLALVLAILIAAKVIKPLLTLLWIQIFNNRAFKEVVAKERPYIKES